MELLIIIILSFLIFKLKQTQKKVIITEGSPKTTNNQPDENEKRPPSSKKVITAYKRPKGNYPLDFIVIDTETTGLDPLYEEIVQLGAIKYKEGIEVDRYNAYVDPGIPIPIVASNIHKIYNKDVKGKPKIGEVLKDFRDFIGEDMLIAHNARFDMKFIQTALNTNGYELLTNEVIDTLELSRQYINTPNHKLITLKKYLKINAKSHDAIEDCYVAGQVYLHCRSMMYLPSDSDSNAVKRKDNSIPSEFEKECYLYLCNLLKKNNKDIDLLRYSKKTYFDILMFYRLLRIKESSRSRYLLVESKYIDGITFDFKITPASKTEGENKRRAHIRNVADLKVFDNMILEEYNHSLKSINDYVLRSKYGEEDIENYLFNYETISNE